jgi:hypothetical protein
MNERSADLPSRRPECAEPSSAGLPASPVPAPKPNLLGTLGQGRDRRPAPRDRHPPLSFLAFVDPLPSDYYFG